MSRRQFFGMLSTKQAPRIWKGDGIYGLHKVSVKHWWKLERELHEGFTWSQNPSGEEGGGKELGPVQKQKPKAGEDGRIVSGKVLGWEELQLCVMEISIWEHMTWQSHGEYWGDEPNANMKIAPHYGSRQVNGNLGLERAASRHSRRLKLGILL